MQLQQLASDLSHLGALFDLKNNRNSTGLHLCAQSGQCSLVKLIASSGIGISIINEQNLYGLTPLHTASRQGYLCVVTYLLANGASLLIRDNNQRNPLHLAAVNGHTIIIAILDSQNAQLRDEKDIDGVKRNHIH